jgi:hypothetical protein
VRRFIHHEAYGSPWGMIIVVCAFRLLTFPSHRLNGQTSSAADMPERDA